MEVYVSTTTKFTQGQSVFSRDGHKHLVRETLPDGRVLTAQYLFAESYDGECEEYAADTLDIRFADELSAEAPRKAIDEEVAKANATLAVLRQDISKARAELLAAQRDAKQELASLEKYPKFTRLTDYLEGKITHFVVNDYASAYAIKTWEELAVYREDKRDKGIKLLTLYGNSDGNTEWRLNEYRDGSGLSHLCFPFTCYADAETALGGLLEGSWVGFNPKQPWSLAGAVKTADAYGKPVPQHIRDALAAHAVEVQQRKVDKLCSDLDEANAALAKARGEVVS